MILGCLSSAARKRGGLLVPTLRYPVLDFRSSRSEKKVRRTEQASQPKAWLIRSICSLEGKPSRCLIGRSRAYRSRSLSGSGACLFVLGMGALRGDRPTS